MAGESKYLYIPMSEDIYNDYQNFRFSIYPEPINIFYERIDNKIIKGGIFKAVYMNGKEVDLYNINGIYVSGSHLVLGTDNNWKCVSSDERAVKVDIKSNIIYCFNTTTHNIPVFSSTLNNTIMFRDWEEIDDTDVLGQYIWIYTILKTLNNDSNYLKNFLKFIK